MKTALIIHGIGGHAGIHWQQWLNYELTQTGYEILMPNMPESNHPDRNKWLSVIKETLAGVDLKSLTIIGHSLGVTTAVDFIEQSDKQINGLISVSGIAKDYGAVLNSYFLIEKPIDFNLVRQNLKWATVIYGDNDPYVPQNTLKFLADSLNVNPIVIKNGGHINTDSGYTKLPEVMKAMQ